MQAREAPEQGAVMEILARTAAANGLDGLAERLRRVEALAADDLARVADDLVAISRTGDGGPVSSSVHRMVSLPGKRLRPLCVALCARLGDGGGDATRHLAVAAEIVHGATLLHDDVVDLGETRRGAPTARLVYGNAASVFAGDWMLVEALRRVQLAGIPGLLDSLLSTVEEMIGAESLQLEGRGVLKAERSRWERIARGKTAALFSWACRAGSRAGGLDEGAVDSLGAFGVHLGMAFQLVDDVLDFEGNQEATGKQLFSDLREGKLTLPLAIGIERRPSLAAELGDWLAEPDAPSDRLLTSLRETGAFEECRQEAERTTEAAITALSRLPDGAVRDALETMALAALHRDR